MSVTDDKTVRRRVLNRINQAVQDDPDGSKNLLGTLHDGCWLNGFTKDYIHILAAIPEQVTRIHDVVAQTPDSRYDICVDCVINGLRVRYYGVSVYGLLLRGKTCTECGRTIKGNAYECSFCDEGGMLCEDCSYICAVCGDVCCTEHAHSDLSNIFCPRHRCADIECAECRKYMEETEGTR